MLNTITISRTWSKVKDKDSDILGLKKEIDVKDEIILSIKKGLNKKVEDFKVKSETPEEALKKEKKVIEKVQTESKNYKGKTELQVTTDIKPLEDNNETKNKIEVNIVSLTCDLCEYETKLKCEMG